MSNTKSSKPRNSIYLAFLLTIILSLTLTGCGLIPSADKNKENEIRLRIQLDLEEDIGLLIVDANLDGQETSGGISNVDKTMLKKDEVLDWSIDKEPYGEIGETYQITITGSQAEGYKATLQEP